MKIGILGYFGFGNYGDELFHQVWRDLFFDHQLITFEEVTGLEKCMHSNGQQRQQFIDSVDVLLIGGGDLIRPSGKINYWFPELLSKPIFLYGLGVAKWLGKDPEIVEQIVDFLKHKNVKQIGLRDIQSKNWLKELDSSLAAKIEVTPDIVFSMPKIAPEPFTNKRLGIITRHQKNYTPERIEQMKYIVDLYTELDFEVVELLASTGPEKQWDIEGSKGWDLGVEVMTFDNEAEITRAISSCDLIYSMKFHGCVVGLLHHVPTVSLLKTDKFKNLYKNLALDNWLIGGNQSLVKYEDIQKPRAQLWMNIDTLTEYSNVGLAKLRLSVEKAGESS
ncbi:MAG: polysaccharide pyruvyl transferase WcaK-like protein [Crocinitomix sp.]|jgi:polysaccharide pyruvyl transferase WcaK-like protein